MKKYYSLFLFFSLLKICANAQMKVGDNPTTIDASAQLQIDANGNRAGVLLPRVALSQTTVAAPAASHVAGLVVYNTATANDVVPGMYYNDGTKWVKWPVPKVLFAKSNGTQSIPVNVFTTCNDFNNVTRNDFSSGWSNGSFTVPAGNQGWYQLSFSYASTNKNTATNVFIRITVAGNFVAGSQVYTNSTPTGIGIPSCSTGYYLNAGDVVNFQVFNAAASTANGANTSISILKVE